MTYKLIMLKFVLLLLILPLVFSCSNKKKNPREMNGKTYLHTADSVYFISFTIDSVIPMEHEPEDRRP